ncbi:MAG: two-component system response regulator [Rhodocyclales bacterium GWA2_65_20]|nr:MAG: two-component system response regulator [Rhodocyclales bacterium GWA2_65_20]
MIATGALGSLSVFLVEPSATQAKFIVAQLQAVGIGHVRTFGSGGDALAAMRAARPDLVVSALYLPDMAGTELIGAMRREPDLEQVAFILISSETRPQALEPVRQAGVCGILPKPFDNEQLKTALATTLDFLRQDSDLSAELDGENLRVLLVDDSPSARKFMRHVLGNLGIEKFVEAENGRAAVAILADTQVDLVVTDYNMPEMDGQELVAYIRQQSWQNSVPVLMVTSESNQGRLAAVQEAGVSGICDKPFEPAVIKRLLWNMLEQR